MNTLPPTPRSWRLGIAIIVASLTILACREQELLGTKGQAALGVICFLGVGFFFCENLRALRARTLITGILLQVGLALLILKVEPVRMAFQVIGAMAEEFLSFSMKGAAFVFGPLVNIPALEKGLSLDKGGGVVFACVVLPTIIFVSSFFAVLYHVGILQFVVEIFEKIMRRVMGTSGPETLSVTANVFLGQTEAPLIVKPFIPTMTRSELLALMIGGMAHISGALMAVYIGMGADAVAILTTSVMAAPASLYISKLLLPQTEKGITVEAHASREKTHANVIDAAAGGASDGMRLAINVAAMLIAFIAGIAMIDYSLGQFSSLLNDQLADQGYSTQVDLSLKAIFSKIFYPVAVLMGVQGPDAYKMGDLLGTKLVLNEFVAYAKLTTDYRPSINPAMVNPNAMSQHAYFLAAFALTGFANFSSVGILLGGIGGMAENRRKDLARLGMRALLGGFLATLINASIAGLLI